MSSSGGQERKTLWTEGLPGAATCFAAIGGDCRWREDSELERPRAESATLSKMRQAECGAISPVKMRPRTAVWEKDWVVVLDFLELRRRIQLAKKVEVVDSWSGEVEGE
jgi:hypothetical protein